MSMENENSLDEAKKKKGFLKNPFRSKETTETNNLSYEDYVAKSKKEDFSEEEKLKFIYRGGMDLAGRPLVIIVGALLPAKKLDPDRLFLYVISFMDSFVENEYALIYLHSGFSAANRPTFSWLRRAYRVLNRKYKKNLKSLYIVHPTFWIRTTFKLFKPFISAKFWQKLTYIYDAQGLYKYINKDQVELPKIFFEVDSSRLKTDPIFGVPLEQVLDRYDHADYEVPIVVEKSIKYLKEKNAKDVQGIFRLNGNNAVIMQLKKDFDKGGDVDLSGIDDPHTVAGLLKLYFRDLPEPLFPFIMYDNLIESHNQKEKTVEALIPVLDDLPASNKALLRTLLELLADIASNSEVNKMNSSNLSIVFAPNLIRSPKDSMQAAVMHAPIVNSIMRTIIDHYEEILPSLQIPN